MGWPSEQKNVNADGYAEAFTGIGTSKDRSSMAYVRAISLMQEVELCDLYIGNGFARRIVDSVAEEMTRAGFELEELEEKIQIAVQARMQELDVMKHLNNALRWSRCFGGAVIVLGLNDGGTFDTPLNEDGIKSVEFIRVYDRFQAIIQTRNNDVMNEGFGMPETWLISPKNGAQTYIVHHSRLIIVDGQPVPDLQRFVNLGWGASVLQSCKDELQRLCMSHQWANMILERNQQAVHKIPNMAQILQSPGGEAQIKRRVDVVDMVRGILNTIVVDAAEDYQIQVQSLTGVNSILDIFAEALSAVSGIPVFVLFGRSKGGLSNTGESEQNAWHAKVAAMQNDILRKPLDRIASLIIQTIVGNDGGNYKLVFCPLAVNSDKEKAETEKLEAESNKIEMETMVGFANIGALDPNEIRDQIREEYQVTGELELPETDESENENEQADPGVARA